MKYKLILLVLILDCFLFGGCTKNPKKKYFNFKSENISTIYIQERSKFYFIKDSSKIRLIIDYINNSRNVPMKYGNKSNKIIIYNLNNQEIFKAYFLDNAFKPFGKLQNEQVFDSLTNENENNHKNKIVYETYIIDCDFFDLVRENQ